MGEEHRSPAIAVEKLCKRFGGGSALDGLSFSVPEGEVFGFVGLNGAGKTTTLRILATLLAADEGEATVCGVALAEEPQAVRAAIGYLPDFFGTYDGLSALEHLEFYAGIHGVPRPRRRPLAGELLELVGLADRRDADVAAFSRGERQRLGLAWTLAHDPHVLLLDEPAAGLDPLAAMEVREVIKELARAGKTVMVSSHDLAALEDMCTWVGLIEGGRMKAVAPVSEALAEAGDGSLAQVLVGMMSAGGP